MLLSSSVVASVTSSGAPTWAGASPMLSVGASGSAGPALKAAPTGLPTARVSSIDLARAALVNRARQAFLAENISLTDFLPPTLNAAPGPTTETGNHIVPLYYYAAAPIGVSTFGLENSSGATRAYVLNTTSLLGTFSTKDPLGLQAISPYYGTLQDYGDQLNTVLNNTTVYGKGGYDFWLQNVIGYNDATHALSFLLNIWNFSSPSGVFPSTSILHGQGRVVESEVYETSGPSITIAYPFTLDLYLNTTVGSYSGSPMVNEVYFNYTVLNSTGKVVCPATEPTGDVCGEYDNVYFNSQTNVAHGSAEIQANGEQYTPLGLPSDMEMDVGIGQSDGANANVVYSNATVGLYVLNATTHTYVPPPSAYDFGSETGETGQGAYTTWNTVNGQPVAYLRTGPSLLTGLWNVTGRTDGAPTLDTGAAGAYALNYAGVSPGNAFLAIAQGAGVTNQSFFQVAPTFGWYTGRGALGKNLWLQPGTYTVEVMLSGYTEVTQTVALTSNYSLSISLSSEATPTVYTPLWAYSAQDLANLSVSGAGTAASPYVLLGSQPGSLAPVFAIQNDYLFIVFSGIWINSTSAYFEFNPPPSLEVTTPSWWASIDAGLEAAYGNIFPFDHLPMYFYHASNFVVENGVSIGLWSSDIEVGHNYAAYCNLCSNSLFASNYFNVSSEGIDYLGSGTNQHNWVWGNEFVPYTAPGAGSLAPGPAGTYGGVSAPSTGLALAEGGDHVYNNVFYTNRTLTSTSTSLLNYYNATGGYEPASNWVTVLGVNLTGSILGGPLQGGNYYRDYGALPNPYGVLPYVSRASSPTGSAGIGKGGDSDPLATLPGECVVCRENLGLYHVTFTETGLASGASWMMKVYGVPVYEPLYSLTYRTNPTNTSTTTTAGFWLPNGTYAWAVSTAPSGYAAVTQTGTLTVSGASVGISVSFGTAYTETVTESGLRIGTVWWFNITGRTAISSTVSASTKSIGDPLPNGTYNYAAGGVPHYAVTSGAATGSITISGTTPAGISLGFSLLSTVTFTETGLPASTEWFVNVSGGPSYSSVTSTISFGQVNGTYLYAAASANPAYSAPGGSFTVSGTAVTATVPFSELFVAPSASPNPTQATESTTISAGATGGSGVYTSYLWSGLPSNCAGPGSVASFVCTPSLGGSYPVSVTVTDSNGARVTGSFTLTVEPALADLLSATPATTQVDRSSTLTLAFSGGVAPVTWTLEQNGSSANLSAVVGDSYTFSPVGAGTYTFYLNATDAVGSVAFATTTVTVEPSLVATLSASPSTTQVGTTSVLSLGFSGGVAPVTWTLEVNGSSKNLSGVSHDRYAFTPTAAGTYTFYLNATDAVGSPASATVVVSVEPGLAATLSATPSVTQVTGSSTIRLGLHGGVAPVAWTLEENGSPANLSGVVGGVYTFTPGAAGTYTFYLNASDAVGSVSNATVTITVEPALAVTLTASVGTLDVGQATVLTLGFSGGVAPVAWTLVLSGSAANLTGAAGGSYTFAPSAPGIYTFYLNATDAVGSRASASATVRVDPAVGTGTLSATPNPVLVGQTTVLATTGATGGDGSYTYAWTGLPPGCTNPGSVASFPCTPSQAGLYSVKLTVTDTIGGTASASLVLNVGAVYPVVFAETGLPAGTTWYVNISGGASVSGSGTSLSTTEPNGTYHYTVGTTNKTYMAPRGVFVVNGAARTVPVNFSEQLYQVSFHERGLPATPVGNHTVTPVWSVTLGPGRTTSVSPYLNLTLPNGTYIALITGPSGYVTDFFLQTGPWYTSTYYVTVSGPTTVLVPFTKGKTATLTVHEKGLPTGQQWCVALDDHEFPVCSYGSSVKYSNLTWSFDPLNRPAYLFYVISPLAGQKISVKLSSSLLPEVSGFLLTSSSGTVSLTFVYDYAVTFTETGAPSGTWSVTMDKQTLSNTSGDPITFYVPNGTYSYKIGTVSGYTSTGLPKKVVVHGAAVPVAVTFTKKKPPVPRLEALAARAALTARSLVGPVGAAVSATVAVGAAALFGVVGVGWALPRTERRPRAKEWNRG